MRLEIDNLSRTYGTQRALDGLSLALPEDIRCLALIGPSGGGKSTLLRHIGGLEVPETGHIRVDGEELPRDEEGLREYRKRNGFLFQSYNLFPHLTALENITLPLIHVHQHTPHLALDIASKQLERFGLAAHGGKHPAQLSGGQQQRVALIRAIAANPGILFLDEPTAALDPEMTVEVLELIRELIRDGQQILLCTHEMGFARAVADRIAFVASGRIVECAPPPQLFGNPADETVRRFLGRVLEFR